MSEYTIWHNPRCTKSRQTLGILEEQNADMEVFKYLDETPDADTIRGILKKLGLKARELMRTKEAIYKELNLKAVEDEEALIQAMAENPKLIERPIVIKGDKAVLGRPPEKVLELF